MDTLAARQVDRFCYQYLQFEQKLDYPQGQFLRQADVQDAIYNGLFAEDSVQFGPPTRYKLRVLKDLVSRIESSIDDWDEDGVSDDLMSAFSELLCTPIPSEFSSLQKKCYVTYHLSTLPSVPQTPPPIAPVNEPHRPYITLLENRAMISAAGTTGLRTWEAAFHLGQYLCHYPDIVSGKRVLELGAGTGYVSILCAKYLGSAHSIASDGSDDVINNLPENLSLNQLQESTRISLMDIKWGHTLVGTESEPWNSGQPVDVVLGADVTYNETSFAALVATMADLFSLYPKVEMYISATQRKKETTLAFIDECWRHGLLAKVLPFHVLSKELQYGPFYDNEIPIHIFKVSKTGF